MLFWTDASASFSKSERRIWYPCPGATINTGNLPVPSGRSNSASICLPLGVRIFRLSLSPPHESRTTAKGKNMNICTDAVLLISIHLPSFTVNPFETK
jgi:hypothetical protein